MSKCYWIREYTSRGLGIVEMYFVRRLYFATDEGRAGDYQVRPTWLGMGEHTCTVSKGDIIHYLPKSGYYLIGRGE